MEAGSTMEAAWCDGDLGRLPRLRRRGELAAAKGDGNPVAATAGRSPAGPAAALGLREIAFAVRGWGTKMITVNCSLKISVYNPAPTYGIHVSSSAVNLIYSQIAIATGEVEKYYQPRKSHRTVSLLLQGEKVPLYGAGAGLALSSTGGAVPLTLEFEIISRGYVVGKLVRVTHKKRISCPLTVDSNKSKPIRFFQSTCTYS